MIREFANRKKKGLVKSFSPFHLFTFSLLLMACGGPSIPSEFTQKDQLPAIYPDYTQVTVPVNMAPLSFEYDGEVD